MYKKKVAFKHVWNVKRREKKTRGLCAASTFVKRTMYKRTRCRTKRHEIRNYAKATLCAKKGGKDVEEEEKEGRRAKAELRRVDARDGSTMFAAMTVTRRRCWRRSRKERQEE